MPYNVNPLTGEVVADPRLLEHRPLAVKIDNEPACARPQFGLNRAAVVFEHYVEAWGTRFTAIFYGQPGRKIGAVRSARLIDLELPAIFDAILVTSGASGGVKQRLDASDFASRIIGSEWQAPCPPLCRVPVESVGCADLEHTLFVDQPALQALAAAGGLDRRSALSGWTFGDLPAGGEAAERLQIRYLNSPATWFYDEAKGVYLRSQDGVRQADAETHLRLTAANVAVLFAHHTYSDIRESTNFYSLEIQLWGQGPVLYFRDGRAYRGTWRRAHREGLFDLLDASGEPYVLKPGRTWFELVPLDSPVHSLAGEMRIEPSVLAPDMPPAP